MRTLLRILVAVPFFALVGGCGCTSDGGGGTLVVPTPIVQFLIGTKVAPIEVPPPPPGKRVVDVLFLLDDGASMEFGRITGDGRIKADVAKAVIADTVQNLLGNLQADQPGQAFDLAFGMARYEDFGGTFNPGDPQGRPFILNQPILRQLHPQFAAHFAAAVSRDAPGTGGTPTDAQTVIEALWQIAEGTGFDGDGDGSTLGSGAAGQVTTQIAPGVSGDVPAPVYVPAGTDADGEPLFTVGEALASGNVGGVGWRPEAVRYVVVFSDIWAVTPFPEDPAGSAPPATVFSSTSATGPRQAETVNSQAFAGVGGPGVTLAQQRAARFGRLPEPVAPAGAATLQETIAALNALDIEVLSVGLPASIGTSPTKPNQIGDTPPAIPDPQGPSKGPFEWMSAVAILTGARDTDGPATPPGSQDLPLVYTLTKLAPLADPVQEDLREDLSDRVAAWGPTGVIAPMPGSLTWRLTMDFPGLDPCNPPAGITFDPFPPIHNLSPPPADPADVTERQFATLAVDDADTQDCTSQARPSVTIRVPYYYTGQTPPPAVPVLWLTTAQRVDATLNVERMDAFAFRVGAEFLASTGARTFTPAEQAALLPDAEGTFVVVLPEQVPGSPVIPGSATLDAVLQGCGILDMVNPDAPAEEAGDCVDLRILP